MTAPRFADTFPDLKGRRVVVVGAGKSGLAAARLALDRGARVTLADQRDDGAWPAAAETLAESGATLLAGGHPVSLLDTADLVVLSPGVPAEIDLAGQARKREIPVWGEVELASRFARGRIVGITGSNGKSTVTAMTGAMLRSAGIPGGTEAISIHRSPNFLQSMQKMRSMRWSSRRSSWKLSIRSGLR